MEIDYGEIGEKIYQLRNSKKPKVSREKLAEAVGVSSTSIYRWEKGIDRPELPNIAATAKFLGVPLSYLIGEDPSIHNSIPKDQIEKEAKDYVTKDDLEKLQDSLIEKLMEKNQRPTSNEKESNLIEIFGQLTPKGQNLVLDFAIAALKDHKAPVRSKRVK